LYLQKGETGMDNSQNEEISQGQMGTIIFAVAQWLSRNFANRPDEEARLAKYLENEWKLSRRLARQVAADGLIAFKGSGGDQARFMTMMHLLQRDRQKAPGGSESARKPTPKGSLGLVITLGVIVLLGFLYMLASGALQPQKSIIFKPDDSRISGVDQETLKYTAEILTARAHDLGYSRVSFEANYGTRLIIGKIPASVDPQVFFQRISPIGLLEFVEFGNTLLEPGTLISTDFETLYSQPANDKIWHTVMTNQEFQQASAGKDPLGLFQIQFTLSEAGSSMFSDYTAANVGNHLGIVLDKVILSVPRIQAQITNGQGVIAGSYTQASAEDLAVLLKFGPLPIPILLSSSPNPTQ
jgi:hypothetical protein